jgi:hypothetical protein
MISPLGHLFLSKISRFVYRYQFTGIKGRVLLLLNWTNFRFRIGRSSICLLPPATDPDKKHAHTKISPVFNSPQSSFNLKTHHDHAASTSSPNCSGRQHRSSRRCNQEAPAYNKLLKKEEVSGFQEHCRV